MCSKNVLEPHKDPKFSLCSAGGSVGPVETLQVKVTNHSLVFASCDQNMLEVFAAGESCLILLR